MNEQEKTVVCRVLGKYPEIKDGVMRLCHMAEAASSIPKLADDLEDTLVEDLRGLGAKVFARWAECRMQEESKVVEQNKVAHKHGKKKSRGIQQ
jgi:hypothetical protein